MDSHRDLVPPDEPDEHPFSALWFLMGLVWGRLLWPLAIANALAWAWLGYRGWRSLMAFLGKYFPFLWCAMIFRTVFSVPSVAC